jgi:ferredoxin-NADP reductase
MVRALVQAAVTPLLPEDYADLVAPLRGRTLRAQVVAKRWETPRAVSIELRPGATWAGHRPGQYVRLGVDIDGVRHWRSYSLTSIPGDNLSIAVTAQGPVSDYLVRRLRVGQFLMLDQAAGDFGSTLGTKVLFVTAGSGITPVMGLLRSGVAHDAVVVHSARSADEVIFGSELRVMARAGRIGLIERHTRQAGRLVPDDLVELVPDLAQRQPWVCGPNDLIDGIADHFTALGLPRPGYERFRPVLAPAGRGGEISFTRAAKAVQVDGATSLLEAGEAAGVLMPHGCRMGICYGCVTPLTQGSVRDLRDGSVTTADEEPVLIQTCINAAAGPCALDV